MRVVITGAAGQVGRNLVRQSRDRGYWVGGTFKARRPAGSLDAVEALDKSDPVACDAVLDRLRPDVVIDTGALHNVDYCEAHPDEADAVNHRGTQNLARSAHRVGARLVFVSTDFVFDGARNGPYSETDTPRPQSAYARSKLAGETATLSVDGRNLVVRPSVIYSWLDTRERAESSSGKGLNFGTWLVEEVAAGRPVRIVEDQVASPTLASDLAGAILALVAADAHGVFHAAGATAVTRYEFSRQLVRGLSIDTDRVIPVATATLQQKAVRPMNSSLASDRLAAVTGYRTLDLDAAIARFVADFRADPGAPVGR